MHHNLIHSSEGIARGFAINRPLARCEAADFEIERVLPCFEAFSGGFCIDKGFVSPGWNVVFVHEFEGKIFVRFNLRRRLRGAKDREAAFREDIDNAICKRGFRADHRNVNVRSVCKVREALEIAIRNIDTFGVPRHARAAGAAYNFVILLLCASFQT